MNLIDRKDVTNTLTKKAPNTIDINMQSRLNILKKNLISFNLNNNNNININDNNNLPARPPPSPPPSPPKQDHFFQPSFPPQQATPKQIFFCTSTKNIAPRYQHCGYHLMIIF